MTTNRRLHALHAFIALGLVKPTKNGWECDGERRLPAALADVFVAVCDGPTSYPLMTRDQQAATAWLVRAAWLVPNLGWSRVQPNDLAEIETDDDEIEAAHAATNPRETALMRIVEAAHHADDLRKHPGETVDVEATRAIVRRYLTALGYTAYNSVRDLPVSPNGTALIGVSPANDAAPSSVWLLRPIGTGVDDRDVKRVRRTADAQGVTTAVATDGLQLVAADNGTTLDVDLRKIGRNQQQFDLLITLAVEPAVLAAADK
jgi:hypothetical protein